MSLSISTTLPNAKQVSPLLSSVQTTSQGAECMLGLLTFRPSGREILCQSQSG